MLRKYVLIVAVCLLTTGLSTAAEATTKIVLIGKDRDDHAFGTHEYLADCELLARCLRQSPNVEAVVSNGWPKDAAVLKEVNAVVLVTQDGGQVVFGGPHRRQAEELLKNGVGLTAIHWSNYARQGEIGTKWLGTMGGWFNTDFSRFLTLKRTLMQPDPQHPVCRGWKEFELRDDYYIQLRFAKDVHPVMTARIEDKDQTVGWVYERPDSNGGRSFGFVGGHFHDNYSDKSFRQMLVNGILWTAHREVPPDGAPCRIFAKDLDLPPDQRVKVALVTGQSNHDWRATTPEMKRILDATNRFKVTVITAPPHPKDKAGQDKYKGNLDQYKQELARFKPDFSRYDLVLSNYNGDLWPEETRASLEKFVSDGKGLVIIHAANHPFHDWRAFNQMMGMGWREDKNFGAALKVSADGEVTIVPKGQGQGSTYDPKREILVTIRDPEHPITRGMPRQWMHAPDEIYHGLRGPAENVHLLASVFSDPKQGGTGEHEPALWTVTYGKGRVFVSPLGHDVDSMRCVGFMAVLQRGAEWAATGRVTLPLPADFPTAEQPRSIPAK